MTPAQKILFKKLLTGHFLRKVTRKSIAWYVLYDAKVNPICKVRTRTIDKIDQFIDPKMKLWKKTKSGAISLNLATVRQLSGRTTMKKLYKQRAELESTGALYKTRIKKSTKKTENEKVYYLF